DGRRQARSFRVEGTRGPEVLRLPDMVRDAAQHARDATRARQPRTRLGPVVLSDIAADQFLAPSVLGANSTYLSQTSGGAAYARLSRFEIGEPVFLGRAHTGDP